MVESVPVEACVWAGGDPDPFWDHSPDRELLFLPPGDRLREVVGAESCRADDDAPWGSAGNHLERQFDRRVFDSARSGRDYDRVRCLDGCLEQASVAGWCVENGDTLIAAHRPDER